MSVVYIDLPWLRPPLTGNDRGHTKFSPFVAVKGQAQLAVRVAKVRPVVACRISLHWLIPDKRRRDSDNLFPTLKACQDALVAEGVLTDDSWVRVPSATCRIHPPTPGSAARMWLELDVIREYDAA